MILGFQCFWTWNIEESEQSFSQIAEIKKHILSLLELMAQKVLENLTPIQRMKLQQMITELVHKRDVTIALETKEKFHRKQFEWIYQMKFKQFLKSEIDKSLLVYIGNNSISYSFEYFGQSEKLVQTPLTDKCYFTLTHALNQKLGGAPFGPAGTGKTESVKMLGMCLGRFVLVFNCDENFNFKAMNRIFIGLCQVGAWGCFDEFNRLEEKILSAVS